MRRFGGLLVATIATSVLLAVPVTSAQDELQITRTEVADDGSGTIEFTMPAEYATSIDVAASTTLIENGAPLAAIVERVPSRGLEIVLMIDTSGSMREGGALTAAKTAAVGFLDALPAEVKVGVVSFADTPALTSPMGTDRAATKAGIDQLGSTGETAMYDALIFAELLFSGATADKQILLLSDGGDTVSGADLAQAIDVTSRIRTSAITLVSSEADLDALQQIATAGGGNVAPATDPDALASLYQEAADDLLNRYRVSFTAAATGDVTYALVVSTPDGDLQTLTSAQVATPATEPATTTPTQSIPVGGSVPNDGAGTSVPAAGRSDNGGPSDTVLLIAGAAALFAALLLLLLLVLVRPRPQREATSLRTTRAKSGSFTSAETHGVVARASNFAEGVLERGGGARSLAADLDVSGLPLRPGEFVLLTLVGGFALTLLLAALLPPIVGILGGILLTPLLARRLLTWRMDDRRNAFVEQLPDVLQSMVSSLRGGYGLPQSLDLAANQAAEPAKSELRRVLFEVRVGRDVGEALAAAAKRMKSPDFTWVVAAMEINREVGGELSGVLEKVAETVRERQRLRRQIQVLTAEGRLSAYVLIALPFLIAGYILVTQPDYYEPFGEAPGIFLPFIGIFLLAIGWVWMRGIVRSDT